MRCAINPDHEADGLGKRPDRRVKKPRLIKRPKLTAINQKTLGLFLFFGITLRKTILPVVFLAGY
jgi:hypothetical protein